MGHHGYTLGAQDADGGYLQVAGVTGAVPASLGKGLGHNKDEFVVATDHVARAVHTGRADRELGAPPDAGGDGAPDGLGQLHPGGDGAVQPDGPARGLDDRARVAFSITPEGGQGADLRAVTPIVVYQLHSGTSNATETGAYPTDLAATVDQRGGFSPGMGGTLVGTTPSSGQAAGTVAAIRVNDGKQDSTVVGTVAPTLTAPDARHRVVDGKRQDRIPIALVADTVLAGTGQGGPRTTDLNQTLAIVPDGDGDEDPLLPQGLDSHRYRCCGNGVVAPVAAWVGARLAVWASTGADGAAG